MTEEEHPDDVPGPALLDMAYSLMPSLVTRARVPSDISSVETIDHEREVHPAEVGADSVLLEKSWQAARELFASGIHPAVGMCVRRHGRIILNRTIGYVSGSGPGDPEDVEPVKVGLDSPFNIFSASKAITAMVIHLLDERHLLHLDDPVCEYIPEFNVQQKKWITIKHVLTHRAGLPHLPPAAFDLDHLDDRDWVIGHLAEARVSGRPGRRLAYHAISGGFILGEIVHRVTGKSIREVLGSEILDPLGFEGLNYGVAADKLGSVVRNYHTGLPLLPPVSTVLKRALGIDFNQAIEMTNDKRFLTGIVPSANICGTAEELSRFYELLAAGGTLGGVQVFNPLTIRRATMEQSYLEFDFTLGAPIRYGMGFFLGGEWISVYGPDTSKAFGHLGFTNVLGWADPERRISVGLVTSGKPVLYPELFHGWNLLRYLGQACPRVREVN